VCDKTCRFLIANAGTASAVRLLGAWIFRVAGACSYPNAWTGYWAVGSYDQQTWFRVPSTYDIESGELEICIDATNAVIWVRITT
jgi:hypothetical protein